VRCRDFMTNHPITKPNNNPTPMRTILEIIENKGRVEI
jgi:hypothetical protein